MIDMRLRSLELMVSLFLILATFAVYMDVQNHEFVNFDDNLYVTENRHVQQGLTGDHGSLLSSERRKSMSSFRLSKKSTPLLWISGLMMSGFWKSIWISLV